MAAKRQKLERDFTGDCAVCNKQLPARKDCVTCLQCVCVICKGCHEALPVETGHQLCPACRIPMLRGVEAPTQKLTVQDMTHGFNCTSPVCANATCSYTKFVLKKMRLHVSLCAVAADKCKVCNMWKALLDQTPPHARAAAVARHGTAPAAPAAQAAARIFQAARATAAAERATADAERAMVVAAMQRGDPALLKRLLIAHAQECKSRQCPVCEMFRRAIRAKRPAQVAPP